MDKRFHIGEISQFFNLPASTLRYWENAGILTTNKNTENNYREYTVADLMNLSDLIFYKSLGIPLKQIQTLEHSTPEEHEILFHEKIEELKLHPLKITDIDTDCIVSFDLIEIDKLRQYIENPYLYSRVQHSDNIRTEQRGLTISTEQRSHFPKAEVLWQKNSHTYITCLMKEEITDGYPNNLSELLAHIQKKYRTGSVISRFLLCARENGKLYDFYKTFVEIIP